MKKILISIIIGIILALIYMQVNQTPPLQALQKSAPSTSQFSIKNAPSQSLRGTIASLAGDVEWQSRVATAPAKITQPQQIQQGENIVTGTNGKTTVQFPSAATITLLPNTEVDVVQTLPANIVLNQPQGTATYTKLANIPVSIRTFDLLLQVDGTATITSDPTQDTVVVDVKDGSATAAFDDLNNVSNVVTINAGNEYLFDDNSRSGEIQ